MLSSKLANTLGALIFGAVISFIGILLHNSYQPFGIFLALLATGIGINFTGQLFGSRKYKFIAELAWLAVALRAGSYGLSHEILIVSNLYGNIFLLGGLFVATIAAIKKS